MNRETRKRSTKHVFMAALFIHVFMEFRIFCETTDTFQNWLLYPTKFTAFTLDSVVQERPFKTHIRVPDVWSDTLTSLTNTSVFDHTKEELNNIHQTFIMQMPMQNRHNLLDVMKPKVRFYSGACESAEQLSKSCLPDWFQFAAASDEVCFGGCWKLCDIWKVEL